MVVVVLGLALVLGVEEVMVLVRVRVREVVSEGVGDDAAKERHRGAEEVVEFLREDRDQRTDPLQGIQQSGLDMMHA